MRKCMGVSLCLRLRLPVCGLKESSARVYVEKEKERFVCVQMSISVGDAERCKRLWCDDLCRERGRKKRKQEHPSHLCACDVCVRENESACGPVEVLDCLLTLLSSRSLYQSAWDIRNSNISSHDVASRVNLIGNLAGEICVFLITVGLV
jgi:hypothetical protein